MAHDKLAAQLYTIREHTQTLEDFRKSMKKISDIGYTAVQVSGIGAIAHEDVKAVVDDYGLDICITTSANSDEEGRALLAAFDFPFRQ